MTHWQFDFKDDGVPATDPDGKQQHVVETLNTLDVGSSIHIDGQTREDFTAATTLEAMAQLVRRCGLPDVVQYDRDSRFIGGRSQDEFPSTVTRFWLDLDVDVIINPPHRPDLNGVVERYHRSVKDECLLVHRPKTVEEVRAVTEAYHDWYNTQRPHQGIACGNQPPRVAFPNLPARPGPPMVVDPDRWVTTLDGVAYARRVTRRGAILLDGWSYYVGTASAGQDVTAQIDATARQIVVYHGRTVLKRTPIKGLIGRPLAFDAFVSQLVKETTAPLRKTSALLPTTLQRKTPLESTTPLTRKTPLRQRTPLRRTTPLRRHARAATTVRAPAMPPSGVDTPGYLADAAG